MKFKHLLSLSAFAAMSVCAMAQPAGTGTSTDPYQIKTVDDWKFFANLISEELPTGGYQIGAQPGACAVLCNDLDMSDSDFVGIGAMGRKPGELGREYDCPFTGTFDGQNHVISNVAMFAPHYNNRQGVFVNLGSKSVVKNLFVKDVVAVLASGDGAFCSFSAGTIQDCYITGVVYDASDSVPNHVDKMVSSVDVLTDGIGGFIGTSESGSELKNCVSGVTFEYDAEYYGLQFYSGNVVGLFAGSCAKATKCFCVAGSKGEPTIYKVDDSSSFPLPSWLKPKREVSTLATVADAEAKITELSGIEFTATPVAGVMVDKFMGADDRCTVYSINGSVVYRGAASGMKVSKPGVYIVKTGSATRKMYVK